MALSTILKSSVLFLLTTPCFLLPGGYSVFEFSTYICFIEFIGPSKKNDTLLVLPFLRSHPYLLNRFGTVNARNRLGGFVGFCEWGGGT